jgi:branched-chain amino acid transport system substrate-binding protein
MRKKFTFGLLIMTALMLILQGCATGAGGGGDKIKIVVVGPMTEAAAQFGDSMKNGVELAVEEINKNGGLLGKEIEIEVMDDKGNPKEAVTVAQRISQDRDVAGVIGHFTSGATMAASPIYQKAGIPEIAIASTHPEATAAGDYIFRQNVTNTGQGAGIIKWLNEKGKKRIAIMYDNDDYGNEISKISKSTAEDLGMEVVYFGSTSKDQKDFHVMINSAKEGKPDALVVFNLYATSAQIITQAKNNGLDVLTVGSDAIFTPDFIDIAAESSEGVYAATWFHPNTDNQKTQEFLSSYQEKFNADSDSWSPYAYDAMKILGEAIEKAGEVDREKIRDALAKTKDYEGATGTTTFTEERVPDISSKELLFTVVEDNKFKLINE